MENAVIQTVSYIAIGFIIAGIILAGIRFILGPEASDRVVAADTTSVGIISGLVLLGYIFERFIYVDVSLIYAALGFIGVLVIARYLEGGV